MNSPVSSTEKLDLAVKRHLEWWRAILTSPTAPTNRDLATQVIKELYCRIKGKEPDGILWCDSPFQLAVVPPVIIWIVQSSVWSRLSTVLMSCGGPGSTNWEKKWQEWLERNDKADFLAKLVDKHIRNSPYRSVQQHVKDAAVICIKELLHRILLEGRLSPYGIQATRLPLMSKERRGIVDTEFLKDLVSLNGEIERKAGLKLTAPTSIGSILLGVWDSRLITQLVPGSEFLFDSRKRSTEELELARRIKSQCAELERISLQMLMMFQLQRFDIRFFVSTANRNPSRPLGARTIDDVTHLVNRTRVLQDRVKTEGPDKTNNIAVWLPYVAIWLPFALACRFIAEDFFGELQERIDSWAYLSHAASGYLFLPNLCFACSKPTSFSTNNLGRLHNSNGPAIEWSDGFKTYAWRGVVVPPDLIEEKQSITCQRITTEENVELRRVMVDIYGESRYLIDSSARILDDSEFGTLYRLDVPNDEPLVMVRVINSTPEPDGTFKTYFLRVPATIRRAKQAVAWTFGLEEEQYIPSTQS